MTSAMREKKRIEEEICIGLIWGEKRGSRNVL